MSGLLVAAITKIWFLSSIPFSSFNKVLTTLSVTWLPESCLLGANASNSSKKITEGAELLALSKTFLTAYSLSPTYLVSNYGPLTVIKLTLASLAIPLASMVLPQPGGPYKRTPPPLISKLSFLNFSLDRMGRMISLMRAYLMCYKAPMSLSLVVGILANPYLFSTGTTSLLAARKSYTFNSFSNLLSSPFPSPKTLLTHLFTASWTKLTISTATYPDVSFTISFKLSSDNLFS